MPEDLPLKPAAHDCVAARTRTKLGTPVYLNPRIQYPDSWPLLKKAIFFSKLQLAEKGREKTTLVQTKSANIDKARRCVPRIESTQPKVSKRESAGNKIRGYYVDLVTFKSTPKRYSSESTKLKRGKKAGKSRKGRSKSKSKRKRTRASSRRAKKGKRKRGGRTRSRRRKVSKATHKKKARALRGRSRRCRSNHEDEETRRTLNPAPPCGHSEDYMLKQKSDVITDCLDSCKDEIRDDPLNIKDICRSLVKSLPGIPADCREENFDEKKSRPEYNIPQRVVYNFQARAADETKDRTPRVKESDEDKTKKQKYLKKENGARDKNSSKNHSRNNRKAVQADQRQSVYRRAKRVDIKKRKLLSNKDPEMRSNGIDLNVCTETEGIISSSAQDTTESERAPKVDVNVTAAHDVKRATSTHTSDEQINTESQETIRPADDYVYALEGESKPDGCSQNRMIEKSNNQHSDATDSATEYTFSVDLSKDNQQDKDGPRKKRNARPPPRRDSRRSAKRFDKPKPRRIHREHMQLMKGERRRFDKLSKVFKKGDMSKRNEMRKEDKIRRLLLLRRKTRGQPTSSRTQTAQILRGRHRRTERTTTSRRAPGGNGNNNMNNNQSEGGVWYRFSGRLFRIGRYLMRQFQLFFW
ncbi:hypothetical protein EGW08_006618 [Elysia chlorotica]|uniref:Uncharacterized protein n=1 Tax=Elysia chlorotica TaxID=188477 RepID=A0A3S1C844_ELYCH|nr:hypothetical protein EGW08_006618 [Elysia chlorotica]